MGRPTHSCAPGHVLLLFQSPETWFAFPLQLEIRKTPFPAEWPEAGAMALLQGAQGTAHVLFPTSHLEKLWLVPMWGLRVRERGQKKAKEKKQKQGVLSMSSTRAWTYPSLVHLQCLWVQSISSLSVPSDLGRKMVSCYLMQIWGLGRGASGGGKKFIKFSIKG